MGSVSAEPPGSELYCTECGRRYPADDLARFGASVICAECKPRYVQRLREGGSIPGVLVYGGFWRRFLALLLDGVILMIVMFPIEMALGMFSGPSLTRPNPGAALGFLGIIWLISLLLNVTYYTYFVSQKGATPGKMVMGMKVITATGERPSVGLAAGRYFAQLLSGLVFGIGFLIAAFDDQKRALHDHICGTRVIRQA
jgi:uncharacterized RDD family membrane protein YckC